MTNYHPDVQRAYESHCADGYVFPDDETGPQEAAGATESDVPRVQAHGDGEAAKRRTEGEGVTAAHHPIACMDHWDRCCCWCGRHNMSGPEARTHAEQADESVERKAARVLWETSRRDEGTISATGADIAARALADAGLLADPVRLLPSEHLEHVHPPSGVEQVGWIGQTGTVYPLGARITSEQEPGSFGPLYRVHSETCGQEIRAQEQEAEVAAKDEKIARLNEQVRYWRDSEYASVSSALDETLDDLTQTFARAEKAEAEVARYQRLVSWHEWHGSDAEARARRAEDWQREVCDMLGYEPDGADEVLTYLPAWRAESSAKDEEVARLREMVELQHKNLALAQKAKGDAWAERDRARDTAAALEAENARLTAKVERVDAVARERDVPWPSKFKFGASDNYLAGFRAANARFRAALSDTTGEAS